MVTAAPSGTPSRSPVSALIATTSPWMVGSPRAALPGCTVTSLVTATPASAAGMTRRLAPPPSDTASRGGAWAAPDRLLSSISRSASASAE
ncbi:MAG TPA: hypothetical protein VKA51_14140 [Rubrobacteraceae bacterium]|nr:hypothetical protein [Rubrobacteraceae bacterium]